MTDHPRIKTDNHPRSDRRRDHPSHMRMRGSFAMKSSARKTTSGGWSAAPKSATRHRRTRHERPVPPHATKGEAG